MFTLPRALCLTLLFTAFAAAAQEGGRTDGAEGSEQGKGGYERPSGSGRLSLVLNWGASAAVGVNPPLSGNTFTGPPLYLGGTASLWMYEWFLFEAHGSYAFNSGRTNVLLGPRFRTNTWPVSGSLGLRAGAILDPQAGLRFGLSPVASVEMIFFKHLLLALEGSWDIPIAGNGSGVRVGLNLGWRF